MTKTYRVWHKPNGKWELRINDVGLDFPTRGEAEAGMARIVKPEIYDYDENGKLVE